MNMRKIDKKESLINKVFWILSCVIVFAFFRFEPEELFFAFESLLIVVRYYMVRELREQRKAISREAELQSAKKMREAEWAAFKRRSQELRNERQELGAHQRKNLETKPVIGKNLNLAKPNDTNMPMSSIEDVSNTVVPTIPCASDIVKAQSVSFSRRAPELKFGLAEEMSKVGYHTVGDLYSDIQKIVTHKIEIATVVKKFDAIADNDYLRVTLTRLLYAAALGSGKPEHTNLKPLALALRTIVESQKIVPRANGGKSSAEMAELLSLALVIAVASCQHGSASALMERLNLATLQFADEKISPDGPSTRRYVTALVICFIAMVFETAKSISIVTDSLAGNRLVPIDISQLGAIDVDYLNANRTGWLTEVIAGSPELQRAYLRHLRELHDAD